MTLTAKLDELGMPAWIALMVMAFIVFWPLGLAVLAYLIWSGRMGCWKNSRHGGWKAEMSRMRDGGFWGAQRTSGNRAFDEYRTETLRRLEGEQREFHDFLARLRMAKDKVEFDQFMAERRSKPEPESRAQP